MSSCWKFIPIAQPPNISNHCDNYMHIKIRVEMESEFNNYMRHNCDCVCVFSGRGLCGKTMNTQENRTWSHTTKQQTAETTFCINESTTCNTQEYCGISVMAHVTLLLPGSAGIAIMEWIHFLTIVLLLISRRNSWQILSTADDGQSEVTWTVLFRPQTGSRMENGKTTETRRNGFASMTEGRLGTLVYVVLYTQILSSPTLNADNMNKN